MGGEIRDDNFFKKVWKEIVCFDIGVGVMN